MIAEFYTDVWSYFKPQRAPQNYETFALKSSASVLTIPKMIVLFPLGDFDEAHINMNPISRHLKLEMD